MGFSIVEPINIVRLSLQAANVYVTLRSSFAMFKRQPQFVELATTMQQFPNNTVKYVLSGRMVIYSRKTTEPIQPLHEENIDVELDSYPTTDPIALLYQEAKNKFAGLTLIDDL